MFKNLFGLEAKRQRTLKQAENAVMREYLSHELPDRNTDWHNTELVALDLETTGLDASKDEIISYGMVSIIDGSVHLDTACHEILSIEQSVPESSAVIHQITDDLTVNGISIKDAIPKILQRLAGKIMLVHFHSIEQGFISAACQKLYGSPFIVPTIDTMKLGDKLLSLSNHTVMPTALRLFNLRKRYGLPQYKAHNALNDALATAELFLAMANEIKPNGKAALKEFLI